MAVLQSDALEKDGEKEGEKEENKVLTTRGIRI